MITLRQCKQCGKPFEISESEEQFYINKGLELPKRCADCRAENNGSAKKTKKAKKSRKPKKAARQARSRRKSGSLPGLMLVLVLFAAAYYVLGLKPVPYNLFGGNKSPASTTQAVQTTQTAQNDKPKTEETTAPGYHFRNSSLLNQHYEKHGREMGFASAADYEKAASNVINSPKALYKTEAEDGDGVYYIEETNEFVVLSTDGYIRTYFKPDGGKRYFDRQ